MKLFKKSQEKIKKLREYLSESPEAKFALKILAFLFPAVLIIDIIPFNKNSFLGNILSEVHGLAFDVIIFGILIVVFNKHIEKRNDIKRWQEEIDDYRGWNEPEAMHRIVGNIRRLNRAGISNIDLYFCFLKEARLGDVDLQDSGLRGANLQEAELSEADLRKARLRGANLQGAFLDAADLSGADLKYAKDLTIAQLSEVKTLFEAKLDPDLEKEMRDKYPHLFEKPK
jgi:hypothetical protein